MCGIYWPMPHHRGNLRKRVANTEILKHDSWLPWQRYSVFVIHIWHKQVNNSRKNKNRPLSIKNHWTKILYDSSQGSGSSIRVCWCRLTTTSLCARCIMSVFRELKYKSSLIVLLLQGKPRHIPIVLGVGRNIKE